MERNEGDIKQAGQRRVGVLPCGLVRDSSCDLFCVFRDNLILINPHNERGYTAAENNQYGSFQPVVKCNK